jgi:hypothetical protein
MSAKPATTSTPPAVEQPSAPVPDQAPATDDLTAPLVAKIGETFNVTTTDENDMLSRADVTVNKMTDLGSSYLDPAYNGGIAGEPADPAYTEHAKHGRFVVFTITYADTLGAFNYDGTGDWSVRMPDGQVYDDSFEHSSPPSKLGQDLLGGTLHQGQRAKGVISFDVPRTHGVLVYANSMAPDAQTVEVKF